MGLNLITEIICVLFHRTGIVDLPVNIYPLSSFRYCRKPANMEKATFPVDRLFRRIMKYVFLFLLYSFPEMAITVLFGCWENQWKRQKDFIFLEFFLLSYLELSGTILTWRFSWPKEAVFWIFCNRSCWGWDLSSMCESQELEILGMKRWKWDFCLVIDDAQPLSQVFVMFFPWID